MISLSDKSQSIDAFLLESADEQLRKLGPITLWIGTIILLVVNGQRAVYGDWTGIVISALALATGWYVVKATRISAHNRIALFIAICFMTGFANLLTHGLIENGRIVLFYACVGSVSLNRWRYSLGLLALSCIMIFMVGVAISIGWLTPLPSINHPDMTISNIASITLYFGIFAGVTQFSIYEIYKRLIMAWKKQLNIEVELREQNELVRSLAEKRADELVALKKSQDELATYKSHLEEMVVHRTAELNVERDRANQANHAKSMFIATMSHELRTPLNSILGYSQLLTEELGEYDEEFDHFKEDVQSIERSGSHLLNLINNVLDLSKIEANQMEVDIRSHQVADLIDEIEINTRPLSLAHKNQFNIVNNVPDGTILTDGQRLKQVVINLLGNSFKFTRCGEVRLEVNLVDSDTSKWLKIDVVDSGAGMDQSFLESIFEPFTQEDGSYSRMQEGTGLGLAISKRFAQLLGGELTVTSRLQHGSTFSFMLPMNYAPGLDKLSA